MNSTERRRAMVVEDDATVRRVARRLLERRGFVVLDAEHTEAALDMLGPDVALDLLLTDVVLPGADGPALARHVRTLDAGCAIVFMSGYGLDAALSRGVATDVHFLDKPFTPETFYAVIERALGGAASR